MFNELKTRGVDDILIAVVDGLKGLAEAALKLLWLVLCNIFADKERSAYDRKAAMKQFAVMYGERFTRVTA